MVLLASKSKVMGLQAAGLGDAVDDINPALSIIRNRP